MWDGAAVGHGEEPKLDRKGGAGMCVSGRACRYDTKARAWAAEECGISIREEEDAALVEFQFEISSFLSLGISGLLLQDNLLSSAMLQESRGTRTS